MNNNSPYIFRLIYILPLFLSEPVIDTASVSLSSVEQLKVVTVDTLVRRFEDSLSYNANIIQSGQNNSIEIRTENKHTNTNSLILDSINDRKRNKYIKISQEGENNTIQINSP